MALVRFSRETEPIECVHKLNEIRYKNLTHVHVEASESKLAVRAGRCENQWYHSGPKAVCWRIFSYSGEGPVFISSQSLQLIRCSPPTHYRGHFAFVYHLRCYSYPKTPLQKHPEWYLSE